MVERMSELDPAARDPRVVSALDHQRGLSSDLVAGLVDPAIAGVDQTGQDQRLRPGPAFGQATLDQQLIGPPLRRQARHPAPLRPRGGQGGTRISGR